MTTKHNPRGLSKRELTQARTAVTKARAEVRKLEKLLANGTDRDVFFYGDALQRARITLQSALDHLGYEPEERPRDNKKVILQRSPAVDEIVSKWASSERRRAEARRLAELGLPRPAQWMMQDRLVDMDVDDVDDGVSMFDRLEANAAKAKLMLAEWDAVTGQEVRDPDRVGTNLMREQFDKHRAYEAYAKAYRVRETQLTLDGSLSADDARLVELYRPRWTAPPVEYRPFGKHQTLGEYLRKQEIEAAAKAAKRREQRRASADRKKAKRLAEATAQEPRDNPNVPDLIGA